MNIKEALEFLQANQPMPRDLEIDQDGCDRFVESLKIFTENPDKRCIPLFVNCVSKYTGLGMYETISSILSAHRRDDVIPFIKEGLFSKSVGIRYRCCWWAIDLDAWELKPQIEPLLKDNDEDIRCVAASYMELESENL